MFKINEIGIDLGSDSIKIAVVDATGRSKDSIGPVLSKLKHSEVYKVNCTPYSEEYYQLLKESIKSFSKKYKLKRLSLNIAVSVDNINTHVHFMSIPVVDNKILDSGISFEAEQKMSAEGITNSYSTWKIISEDESLNQYEVLLANIKKEIVNSLAQFKTVKWKVNRVILQPILLERITSSNDVIIDLGHKSTRIYLYEDGKLSQTEVINIGGKDILKDIEDYLKRNLIHDIDPEDIIKSIQVYNKILGDILSENDSSEQNEVEVEAEDWYQLEDIYGSDTIYEEDVSEIEDHLDDLEDVNEEIEVDNEITHEVNDEDELESDSKGAKYDAELLSALSLEIDTKVSRISDEIKRIVRMFELQSSVSVDKVYYFGQLSNLGYLKESLESELEIQMEPLDILDINSESEDNLTLHSVASLIAMDTKLKDNTNFSKFIKANVDYSSLMIMLLSVSISTGVALKVIGDNYDKQIEELQSVNTEQLQTISLVENDINDVEREINEARNFVDMMDNLKAEKKWLSDMLYIVPDMTPLTVAIKDMNIVNQKITIEGYSSDYSSIGFFANKLKGIAHVDIDSIEEFTEGEVYSVTMDNPELISDKYKIKQEFKMTLTHTDTLLEHDTSSEDDVLGED